MRALFMLLLVGCSFTSPIDRGDEQVDFDECEASCKAQGSKHMEFERSLGRVKCVCLAACEDAGTQ